MMKTIDSIMLKKAFLSGAALLSNRKAIINELNVFPVPDGDTGTNMTMTVMSARSEMLKIESPTVDEICKAVSSGSLRGARGNSGVILSQIFRGFGKAVKGLDEIDVDAMSHAIGRASDTAWKAVMKPKEGTVLTVIKKGAEKAAEINEREDRPDDIIAFLKEVNEAMEEALKSTPDLLPVLKEAGVVDSGGEGLMTFARGFLGALEGNETKLEEETDVSHAAPASGPDREHISTADIKFGYCTEFIIMTDPENRVGDYKSPETIEHELKKYLKNIGDCVVVVADDDLVKVHVHTNGPGLAIQKALTYGQLASMKIDNMRLEHKEILIQNPEEVAKADDQHKALRESGAGLRSEIHGADVHMLSGNKSPEENSSAAAAGEKKESTSESQEKQAAPHKETGFISVSSGEGLSAIFKDLGVDQVVSGGQTMNPSTDDILDAIEKVNADNVIVLPNNGNIIMAAQQAASLCEDRKVFVVPTVNIPQGINVMINYLSDRTPEENVELARENISGVNCGQVTYAVRDTTIDGKEIHKGDFMGMNGKNIVSVESTADAAALSLVSGLSNQNSELVSIYYGEGVTEEEAEKLADDIMAKNPDIEAEVEYGGQPVYPYIISVE